MKKNCVIILALTIFILSLGFISAETLLTKISFEISGFDGINKLDNSNGNSVVITITNSTGIVVSRNAVAGVYLDGMTITMSGAKFNLEYGTNYTYNLSTVYGDFLYNFTTPEAPGGGGGLPGTGQTTSYRTGDDAYHDGTARNDFTRTVQADGNGTVSDSLTGLMWQDGGSGTLLWNDAIDYCNDLEWGGFSDWRLPNYIEFVSVMNHSTTEWNYWPLAFNNRPASNHWTSTTLPPGSGDAYVALMFYGGIFSDFKDFGYEARCVRDQ
jgi:hypothetical protein